MAIHGFFGSLGSGKDTLANYFLSFKVNKGVQVISHCHLNFPYIYMPIDDIFQKAITDTKFFQDKILYISEFHLIMESRRSTAAVNVEFSQNILIQLGKLDCDFYYTCQLLSQMDLRIKEMEKYFYFPHKKFRLSQIPTELVNRIDFDKRIVKHPITNEFIPFDLIIEFLEVDGEKSKMTKHVLPWEILITLFDRFDTREIVQFNREKYKR